MNTDHTNLSQRIGRSGEDYLEAIGLLCHKHGSAQVSDIADMLKVRKPSVTAALHKLADQGLIEYHQYAPVTLTPMGESYAERVICSHTILTRFMREMAGLAPERADEAACHMEHILTYEEITAMGKRLKPPATLPVFSEQK